MENLASIERLRTYSLSLKLNNPPCSRAIQQKFKSNDNLNKLISKQIINTAETDLFRAQNEALTPDSSEVNRINFPRFYRFSSEVKNESVYAFRDKMRR